MRDRGGGASPKPGESREQAASGFPLKEQNSRNRGTCVSKGLRGNPEP